MRDPNRLDKFYEEIKNKHKTNFPDWRFSQMMLNFFQWHLSRYHDDSFYIDENKFIERFKEFIDEMNWGI